MGAAVLLVAAALGPAAAAGAPNPGSIWTTAGDCSTPNPQDQNQYAVGEPVVIRGSGFAASTQYAYSIEGQPGQASEDPGDVVASGLVTTDGDGYFCVMAYTVLADDGGQYKVDAAGKQDAYGVAEGNPNPTPTPTPTPNPTPSPSPTPTPTPDGSGSPVPSGSPDVSASPSGGAGDTTDAVSPPPTDRLSGTSGSADSLGLVLMTLAGALAGVMVLTPARRR